MTLIDDFITDCQLRGIRYPKTAVYYIRDFATTCEDLQNANMADLKRYLAWLRGDAPRGAMGPYVHIDPDDVRKSYLAHTPRLGV